MIERHVCSCSLRLLINMYTSSRLRVKWGSIVTGSFLCLNGVKQGGVLSPVLFCIYMDVLLTRLTRAGVGCYIGNRYFGALCYADDLTLISPSRCSMDIMLNACEQFANEFGVKFNSAKSMLVTFNVTTDVAFRLNNVPIVKVDNAIHLGHTIGKDSNAKNISRGVNNLINSTNKMLSKFSFCSSHVKAELFRSYCSSYYGCVIWNFNSSHIKRLHVMWRKIARRIWNVPNTTHCNLIPTMMSSYCIKTQLWLRYAKFLHNSIVSNNSLVKMCAHLSHISNTPFANNRRSLSYMVNTNSVSDDSHHVRDKIIKASAVEQNVIDTARCITELCEVRDGTLLCDFNCHDINDMIMDLCRL